MRSLVAHIFGGLMMFTSHLFSNAIISTCLQASSIFFAILYRPLVSFLRSLLLAVLSHLYNMFVIFPNHLLIKLYCSSV